VTVGRAAHAATMIIVTALLAGCATGEPSVWNQDPQRDCEARGGGWRATLGFCEYQSGGAGSM